MALTEEISTVPLGQRWRVYCAGLASESQALLTVHRQHLQPVTICKVCGSSRQKRRFKKHKFSYVTCAQCGLVYMNPQPDEELLARFYNDLPIRNFFFRQILLDFAEADQTPFFTHRLERLEQLIVGDKKRLLDVGCAVGHFMRLARQRAWLCTGLELNQTYVEYAQQKRGLNVHLLTLADMVETGEKFDAVTLWDVLEHVIDPRSIFETASHLVNPGGILAFSTINHHSLNAALLRQNWRYYLPPDHLYSFTPRLLKRMLAKTGFYVERIEHQYMTEVLIEGLSQRGIDVTDPRNALPAHIFALGQRPGTWNRIKKLTLIGLNLGSLWGLAAIEQILAALGQGDLITVYARQQER